MDSGLRSHPYFNQRNFKNPEYREMMLADSRSKILSAHHLWNRFHEAPWVDMSKLPIVTWGKTRKKTGEWFSNLPPRMLALGDEPRIRIDENGPNLPEKKTAEMPSIEMAAGT